MKGTDACPSSKVLMFTDEQGLVALNEIRRSERPSNEVSRDDVIGQSQDHQHGIGASPCVRFSLTPVSCLCKSKHPLQQTIIPFERRTLTGEAWGIGSQGIGYAVLTLLVNMVTCLHLFGF
jgi:hypothetical protein